MSELRESCSPELRVFDSPELLVEAAARTICAELAALSTGAEALEKSAGPVALSTGFELHEKSAGHAQLRTWLRTGPEVHEQSAGPAALNTRAGLHEQSAGHAELRTGVKVHEQSARHAELRTGLRTGDNVHEQSTGPVALRTGPEVHEKSPEPAELKTGAEIHEKSAWPAKLSVEHERVSIAIAGGFVSHKLLPCFREFADRIDWNKIDVFWVDERFVAAEDPDRNDAEAMRVLFNECEGVRLHPMPSDEGQSLDEAVARATSQWRDITGGAAFDLVILGMGPDGHIASLFPVRPLHEDCPLYALDDSPKPPARRITFSLPVLRASKRIHLIAAGVAKAEALARVLAENEELEHNQSTSADSLLPAARVLSDTSIIWADSEAAALI